MFIPDSRVKGKEKKGLPLEQILKRSHTWSEEFNIPNRASGSGWLFHNGVNGAEDFSKFHYNLQMFPNLFDRLKNWTTIESEINVAPPGKFGKKNKRSPIYTSYY